MTTSAALCSPAQAVGVGDETDGPSPRLWPYGFAIWTILALVSALQSAMYFARDSREIPWTPILIDRLSDWYTCAIFTPLFFWLVRAIPVERFGWPRAIAAQSVVVAACVPVKYFLYSILLQQLLPAYRNSAFGFLMIGSLAETMAFGAMLSIVHAIDINRRAVQRTAQAARLRQRLAEARLESLTAQLQPHFLFNTLHAISTLMHRDVESADSMLARLGDLLRLTLAGRERSELGLEEELHLLQRYLDIMHERIGERLSVVVDVSDEARSATVPRFLLQPLVENALQHGIGARDGPGVIAILAMCSDGRLLISVTDNGCVGPDFDMGFTREGIGLSNTRERLRERYGDDHAFKLGRARSGGLQVDIDIPFHVLVHS